MKLFLTITCEDQDYNKICDWLYKNTERFYIYDFFTFNLFSEKNTRNVNNREE